jgi:hypothetical protein
MNGYCENRVKHILFVSFHDLIAWETSKCLAPCWSIWQFPQSDQRKIFYGKMSSRLSEQLPALFAVERPRSSRNARPQVPVASHLSSLMAPTLATPSGNPIISIEFSEDATNTHRVKPRRKRRRQTLDVKEIPQPTFWRSDPAVRGKSLGYALGYSGSWTMYRSGSIRYERDTMRKGVHADAIC